jgi:hypothetical protein
MTYSLDHLVVSASNLEAGRAWAQSLMDIEMSARGAHVHMATHNHLVGLDPDAYFEVIAVDPDAPRPEHARWFDLDNFDGGPRLTNWVVRCDDLEEAWERAPANVGRIMSFTRGEYVWRMIVPEDGKPLFDGCFPSLIEWHSKHPAPTLPQCDLRLRRLKIVHPLADELRLALAPFICAMDHVSIGQAPAPALQAEIGTSTGEIWIA